MYTHWIINNIDIVSFYLQLLVWMRFYRDSLHFTIIRTRNNMSSLVYFPVSVLPSFYTVLANLLDVSICSSCLKYDLRVPNSKPTFLSMYHENLDFASHVFFIRYSKNPFEKLYLYCLKFSLNYVRQLSSIQCHIGGLTIHSDSSYSFFDSKEIFLALNALFTFGKASFYFLIFLLSFFLYFFPEI